MKKLHPNEGLKIFDIKWQVKTAGPSPNNNERIEVFLLGCKKAFEGNPCKGCFNSPTWDESIAEWSLDPIEVADMINDKCDPNNKYLTIGGGEPTDQIEKLIPFCKRLKEHGFHILMYTWRDLFEIISIKPLDNVLINPIHPYIMEILNYIDMVVDGPFIQEELILDFNSNNTARNFVGSGNQKLWVISDTTYSHMYHLKNIEDVVIDEENNIVVKLINEGEEDE